jgi:hypothetical protein
VACVGRYADVLRARACGFAGGIAVPNVGGALRMMWRDLTRGRESLLATAFALESVALEALFTAGPLLAVAIIAVASPLVALIVSAGCSLTGTLASSPSDRRGPRARTRAPARPDPWAR